MHPSVTETDLLTKVIYCFFKKCAMKLAHLSQGRLTAFYKNPKGVFLAHIPNYRGPEGRARRCQRRAAAVVIQRAWLLLSGAPLHYRALESSTGPADPSRQQGKELEADLELYTPSTTGSRRRTVTGLHLTTGPAGKAASPWSTEAGGKAWPSPSRLCHSPPPCFALPTHRTH